MWTRRWWTFADIIVNICSRSIAKCMSTSSSSIPGMRLVKMGGRIKGDWMLPLHCIGCSKTSAHSRLILASDLLLRTSSQYWASNLLLSPLFLWFCVGFWFIGLLRGNITQSTIATFAQVLNTTTKLRENMNSSVTWFLVMILMELVAMNYIYHWSTNFKLLELSNGYIAMSPCQQSCRIVYVPFFSCQWWSVEHRDTVLLSDLDAGTTKEEENCESADHTWARVAIVLYIYISRGV